MKIDLSGKTALVTGSSEGIGLASAKALAEAGATVFINGRSREKLEAAVAQIGGQARAILADLADSAGHDALVGQLPQADIVVSNAGIFQPSDFFETSDDVWERHWQLNVMAGVRLARHYLPGMENKGWGRFIFLGSDRPSTSLSR
jgi:NAD(P)-dependent dehydrogenase (short-subunit alcohol dehydrogenase family)